MKIKEFKYKYEKVFNNNKIDIDEYKKQFNKLNKILSSSREIINPMPNKNIMGYKTIDYDIYLSYCNSNSKSNLMIQNLNFNDDDFTLDSLILFLMPFIRSENLFKNVCMINNIFNLKDNVNLIEDKNLLSKVNSIYDFNFLNRLKTSNAYVDDYNKVIEIHHIILEKKFKVAKEKIDFLVKKSSQIMSDLRNSKKSKEQKCVIEGSLMKFLSIYLNGFYYHSETANIDFINRFKHEFEKTNGKNKFKCLFKDCIYSLGFYILERMNLMFLIIDQYNYLDDYENEYIEIELNEIEHDIKILKNFKIHNIEIENKNYSEIFTSKMPYQNYEVIIK